MFDTADSLLQRDITLLRVGGVARPEARERFLRAAQSWAGLNHPYLESLRDIVPLPDDDILIVVDRRQGDTVRSILGSDRGTLHPVEFRRIVERVASALYYGHRKGRVHDAVTPDHVLVGFGELPTVKLLAFTHEELKLRYGFGLGPPAQSRIGGYLAPELAEGHPATPAADIYGLGALMHYLLVGRPPLEEAGARPTATDVLAALDPVTRNSEFPAHLPEVVARCLSFDPQARYSSIEHLMRALYPSSLARVTRRFRLGPLEARAWDAVAGANWIVAIAAWLEAREIDPDSCPYANNIAVACCRQNSYEAALEAFQVASDLDPERSEVWLNLAWTQQRVGAEKGQVLESVKKAVECSPDSRSALLYLGELQDGHSAIETLSRALKLNPDSRVAHLGLARAFHEVGRPMEAEMHLEVAATLPEEDDYFPVFLRPEEEHWPRANSTDDDEDDGGAPVPLRPVPRPPAAGEAKKLPEP